MKKTIFLLIIIFQKNLFSQFIEATKGYKTSKEFKLTKIDDKKKYIQILIIQIS